MCTTRTPAASAACIRCGVARMLRRRAAAIMRRLDLIAAGWLVLTDDVLLAGLDIGGTKIGIALGDARGQVIARDRLDTDRNREPGDLLDEALARLDRLIPPGRGAPIALGLACPGPLSYAEGKLLEVPNLPRWQHYPLLSHVTQRFQGRVAMMNDANASMLAEAYWGAARGASCAAFLTMSTGMGAGLLLDGRIYEGPQALAGEVGHLRLRDDGPVGFGKRGSVEGYLSGPGMVQVASSEALCCEQRGIASGLRDRPITPQRICELASAGDLAALAVIDRCGHELGRLCAMLVDLLNLEVIVLGTIGTAWFSLFEPRARAVVAQEALPAAAAGLRIVPSALRDRGNQTALAIALRAARGEA